MIVLINIILILGIIFYVIKYGIQSLNQLTRSNKNHLRIISILNLGIIAKLICLVWDGNDKAIILLLYGYLLLIILNGSIWFILSIQKKAELKIYKISTIGLAALFIPILILANMF